MALSALCARRCSGYRQMLRSYPGNNVARRGCALLHILQHPADELRVPCRPITSEEFSDGSLFPLAEEMLRLMIEHQGAGLAAPQVGLAMQLIVANPCATDDPRHVMALANPVLVGACAEMPVLGAPGVELGTEGCLSIERGDVEGEVPRWSEASPNVFTACDPYTKLWDLLILHCVDAFRRRGALRRPDARRCAH